MKIHFNYINYIRRLSLVGLGVPVALGLASASYAADNLGDALVGGTFHLDERYRFEYVDDEAFKRDATASTLRTRLGYETGKFMGFSLYGEVEDLRSIGDDRFNSTINGRTDFPVVVEPEATELNRAWIRYEGIPDTDIKVGRQRIAFDNQRFIGNIPFRSNEQTMDAVRLTYKSLPDTTLDYIYVEEVHRIFSDESRQGRHGMDSHLFHAEYTGFDLGKLSAYAYVLDYDPGFVVGFPFPSRSTLFLSSASFGARFKGSYGLRENLKAVYAAEYAHQIDVGDNPNDFNLNYFMGELGADVMGVTGKAGFEFLGSDGTNAFQFPISTAHAFQGWADRFLATPASGVEDLYFHVSTTIWGAKVIGVFHEFDAEEGGAELGHEYDARIVRRLLDFGDGKFKLDGEIKYGNYNSEGFGADTEKLWVFFTLRY
jgi:hypothetical protein